MFCGYTCPANIYQYRCPIVVYNVIANIIVVVAFVVMSALGGNKQAIGAALFIAGYHNLYAEATTHLPGSGRLLADLVKFILQKQFEQIPEIMKAGSLYPSAGLRYQAPNCIMLVS